MAIWAGPRDDYNIPQGVKIAWAMPTYGPLYPSVYQNHLAVWAYTSRYLTIKCLGKTPVIGTTDRMYLHTASNKLVRGFLESDCDYLMWTESDMHMPFYAVIALLHHQKDICAGVYFLRKGGGQPCLYMKGPRMVQNGILAMIPVAVFPENSFFQVHNPGLGCALIHRSVFEAIEEPWFDLREQWDPATKAILGYGQDTFFYSKVADAGKEVWVDTAIHCGQVMDGTVDIDNYRRLIANPDYKPKGFLIGQSQTAEGLNFIAPVPDELALIDYYPGSYECGDDTSPIISLDPVTSFNTVPVAEAT